MEAFDSIYERREPLRVEADEKAKKKSITTSLGFSRHSDIFFLLDVLSVLCFPNPETNRRR